MLVIKCLAFVHNFLQDICKWQNFAKEFRSERGDQMLKIYDFDKKLNAEIVYNKFTFC